MTIAVIERLSPQGIGTGDLESLTSVVRRLAWDEVRGVSDLLRSTVIAPPQRQTNDRNPIFAPTRTTEAINGSSSATRLVVARLSGSYGVALGSTTMLDRDEGIEFRQAFRAMRGWCPACLDEGPRPYDRLTWALAATRSCRLHRIALVTTCRCGATHRPWHARANPFACPHCCSPLHEATRSAVEVDGLSELVATVIERSQVGSGISSSEVVATFTALTGHAGGLRKSAALLGCSPSGLSTVCSGVVRPHLELYLRALALSAGAATRSAVCFEAWTYRARPPPKGAIVPTSGEV
jgi:hypothetical protein